jgi:hypothetical protein
MNYISEVRQQALIAIVIILAYTISYSISCYFGWRDQILLTTGYCTTIISVVFTYVFLGPIIQLWLNLKK